MKFEPIQQNSLADICEAKIRRAIIEGGLKPGDALPGEMELAKKMGVSRNVVREALSRLRMLGVLESRKRRGMILREPVLLDGITRVLDLPVLSDKTKRELLELHIVQEVGHAHVIMDRVRQDHLERLEEIVAREERNPNDKNLAADCDMEFHRVLFEAAENELLSQFQTMLRTFMTDYARGFLADRFEDPQFVDHRMLLEALKRKDAVLFHDLMQKHLRATYSHQADKSDGGEIKKPSGGM
ncbi:FadR family transcriptional regulator [Candidatus Sumerlaeota bacterium]|nr:FadR family transcriptional regulator [Candidatus Sumerlaeota bacterium]